MIDNFLSAIAAIRGPLTLIAFLAVVALALFRRSVRDQRGLEYVYQLFQAKLTKKQFYGLAQLFLKLFFFSAVVVLSLSIIAWLIATIRDVESPTGTAQVSADPSASVAELAQLLSIRGEGVLGELDAEIEGARELLRSSKEAAPINQGFAVDSTQDLESRIETLIETRGEFARLYSEHLEALRESQFVVAHLIVGEIHRLLATVYPARNTPPRFNPSRGIYYEFTTFPDQPGMVIPWSPEPEARWHVYPGPVRPFVDSDPGAMWLPDPSATIPSPEGGQVLSLPPQAYYDVAGTIWPGVGTSLPAWPWEEDLVLERIEELVDAGTLPPQADLESWRRARDNADNQR